MHAMHWRAPARALVRTRTRSCTSTRTSTRPASRTAHPTPRTRRPGRARLVARLLAATAALVPLVPAPAAAAEPDLAPSGLLFGAYVAQRSAPSIEAATAAFEEQVGRRLELHRWYSRWDETMPPSGLRASVAAGRTPVLSVEPRTLAGTRLSWASVARGDHDARIRAQATGVASLGVPVLLAFHHEPELAGTHGTPAEFRAAWRHYVEVFRAAGVTNVLWTWVVTPTVFGTTAPSATDLYPGDDVVDRVGLDAYNWAGCAPGVPTAWRSMATIAGPARDFARAHGKPLLLAEWGSVEDAADPGRKAAWLRESLATLASWPEVEGALYFHQHGTCPWWTDSTATTAAAFAEIANAPAAHGRASAWLRASTVLGGAPHAVTFDASRSAGAGTATGSGVATWRLDPGDGTPPTTGTGTPPTALAHTYRTAGTFLARLDVTDAAGGTATDQRTVTVAAAPTLQVAARAVTTSGAELVAWVDPDGLPGTVRFEWGTSTAYGATATASVPAVTYAATTPVVVTGLAPSTTYAVRVTASTAAGTTTRSATFSTAGAPTTANAWATGTARTSTTLGATVNPRLAATSAWFEWGPTAALGAATAPVALSAVGHDTTLTTAVAGLAPGTAYHYRVVARNAHGTVTGPVRTVTTSR